MDIDARNFYGDANSRPFTLKGVVFQLMDSMEVGDRVPVHSVTDGFGRSVPIKRLQDYLSQHANGRRFSTRNLHDGALCHVFRLA